MTTHIDALTPEQRAAIPAHVGRDMGSAVGSATESYYREVCGLALPGSLSERGLALCDLRSSFEPLTWREA